MLKWKIPNVPDTNLGNKLLAEWPKRLPLNNLERILSAVALVVFAFTVLFVIMRYGHTPEQVPIHFGANGEADDYGSRAMVWGMLLADAACVLGILVMNCFPRSINIPLALMKRPPEEIIRATRLLMCWESLLCAVLFAYLIRATMLVNATVSNVGTILLVAAMLVPTLPYYIYLLRP